jgi:pimeloyl-ACP methyl ester carboxylesterase
MILARQIPHAYVVQIPGTGHSPYFEKPDEWNRIVLESLQGYPPTNLDEQSQ